MGKVYNEMNRLKNYLFKKYPSRFRDGKSTVDVAIEVIDDCQDATRLITEHRERLDNAMITLDIVEAFENKIKKGKTGLHIKKTMFGSVKITPYDNDNVPEGTYVLIPAINNFMNSLLKENRGK